MRIANLSGRSVLLRDGRAADIADASGGQLEPDPMHVLEHWIEFRTWAEMNESALDYGSYDAAHVGPPVPAPRQVFGIGLNYAMHIEESNSEYPSAPLVFTKFPSSIVGPVGDIELSGDQVDWEVELVVVVGRECHGVSREEAAAYIAGVTAGQDISDRKVQLEGAPAQFSLGKSFPGYSPIGSDLVTLTDFDDPTNIGLQTEVNDVLRQKDSSSSLIFDIPSLVSYLSNVVTLYPGDLIFTGTPDGVGLGMSPPVYLQHNDVVVTTVANVGTMTHRFLQK